MNIVVYSYQNSLELKNDEIDLQMIDYETLMTKRFYLLSYIDIYFKRCNVPDERTVLK